MSTRQILLGQQKLHFPSEKISGELVQIDGEDYYKISNYDRMRPFFMTLASDSDVWAFIYSNGGLTAGRKNADHAIFPYYTDDQISALSASTGSKTIILVGPSDTRHVWIPLSNQYPGVYHLERNIYKNNLGNKLIFEEINKDLKLSYRQYWCNSNRFGFIKKSALSNTANQKQHVRMLDGLENLSPPGILQQVQQTKSNLANAYKKSELHCQGKIGIFSLSSNIIDRPEPSESLKATTAWVCGLQDFTVLLSSLQVENFIAGGDVTEETNMRAAHGAYLTVFETDIQGHESMAWHFCTDIDQSAGDIALLEHLITDRTSIDEILQEDILQGSRRLRSLIALADGIQVSSDRVANTRHIANTLFNIMRGGIFAEEYYIEKNDFISFIDQKNRLFLKNHAHLHLSLADHLTVDALRAAVLNLEDDDLIRYAYEYLPLTFSRRHGDPSRPWNRFNIDITEQDGSWKKRYEGNWRDIFQNWEALCHSFPSFTENMVALFLNASTIDGYNPYRITSGGIKWEVTDPEDPWSFIGYWGDHQIIYLLKLLETSVKFHPDELKKYVDKPFFTFANVPYRIKGFDQICKDPYNTIDYDVVEEKEIEKRVAALGADGKLYFHDGNIVRASLTEKLLITLLAKLSNFVPEGGIWMNTQRPEWNDANNALVGHGLSMVTVYYLHRYINFLSDFFESTQQTHFEVGIELAEFLHAMEKVFSYHIDFIDQGLNKNARRSIAEGLGRAGEHYREKVYAKIKGTRAQLAKKELMDFLKISQQYIEHTIRANKRDDGLYHSYNLLVMESNGFVIEHLYPMLEGQVAVLSSGYVRAAESLDILEALRDSEMYRSDQNSYTLYPDRPLKSFMHKARMDARDIEKSALIKKLLEDEESSIIYRDIRGDVHFNPALTNLKDLQQKVVSLRQNPEYRSLVEEESRLMENLFEGVFNHHSFTGGSGTFFAYEGLGSIYWHMNSKLLLAVQEIFVKATRDGASSSILDGLKQQYHLIKDGLGVHKSPEVYGAFPTDPYSHTPAGRGVQQPGMTGQVKEDLLTRIGELGIEVASGKIAFRPSLLQKEEFLNEDATLLLQDDRRLSLSAGELGFSFCGTPIIYHQNGQKSIEVYFQDGNKAMIEGDELDEQFSQMIFQRSRQIDRVIVNLKG